MSASTIAPTVSASAFEAGGFCDAEFQPFERDGFVIARHLADRETCRQMLDISRAALVAQSGPVEYEADLHYPGAPESRGSAGGDTIRRLKEVHGRDPIFTR